MSTLNIKADIVDPDGRVVEERTVPMHIMPPEDPLACRSCGRQHPPELPHDATRMHYQYTFYGEHGRWPTWKDAIAHCDPPIRDAWEAELRRKGEWSEP